MTNKVNVPTKVHKEKEKWLLWHAERSYLDVTNHLMQRGIEPQVLAPCSDNLLW